MQEVPMTYYFNRTLNAAFDEAVARTTEALKAEGFGVLTQIDVKKKRCMRRSHSWSLQSAARA
jgi:uncharacterized protein (DUF302 family)